MKALSYLLLTIFKNRIISLKKKPAMLILYLFVLAFIVFAFIMASFDGTSGDFVSRDIRIIYIFIAGFGLLFLYTYINTGLSTGSTLFTMSDVGLLFVAPISSKKILVYGLCKEMGKTLLTSIFILYQVGNLKMNFAIEFIDILWLFLIYVIMIFFCQLLSIAIYILTNGNEIRKKLILTILYVTLALLVVAIIMFQKLEQISIFEAIMRMVDSHWFGYVPIAGWTTMFFKAVMEGNVFLMVITLGLYLVFSVGIVSLLTFGKADYYEDVLMSTEVRHNTLMAAKEGKRIVQNNKKVKVKDSKRSVLKGSGAITLYYKHILEMRRKSRFVYVDAYSIIAAVAVGIASHYMNKIYGAYIILGVLVYLQFFLTMLGKLGNELSKHYIYLMPQSSLKKVFSATITSILKPCFDAIVIFAAMAIMGGASPVASFFYGLAYAASAAVFVGLTILYQRVLGGQPNKLVQLTVGFGLFFMVMIPAVTITVVTSVMLPSEIRYLGTLPYTLFCVLVTAILFLTCRNLIDKAEYTGK